MAIPYPSHHSLVVPKPVKIQNSIGKYQFAFPCFKAAKWRPVNECEHRSTRIRQQMERLRVERWRLLANKMIYTSYFSKPAKLVSNLYYNAAG